MILTLKDISVLLFIVVLIKGQNPDKKIICHYSNYSVNRTDETFRSRDIPPFLCTHLMYTFVSFRDDLKGITPSDLEEDIGRRGLQEFADLKLINNNLKILAVLGGWTEGSARYSEIVASKDKSRWFALGVVEFLKDFNFDGINLNWEYPAIRAGSKDEDKKNFVQFVKILKDVFDSEKNEKEEKLLLTISIPAYPDFIEKGFDLPELEKYSDFMTVPCYNLHLSTEPYTNHHSPLYPLPEEMQNDHLNHQLNTDWVVKYMLNQGIPREKLIPSFPTFGITHTLEDPKMHGLGAPTNGEGSLTTRDDSTLPYRKICQLVRKNWNIVRINVTSMGPYAYNQKDWVSYDDEESAKRKGEYARDNNLGGIALYNLNDDDYDGNCGSKRFPLITAAKEAFLSQRPTPIFRTSEIKPLSKRTNPIQETNNSGPSVYIPLGIMTTNGSTPTSAFDIQPVIQAITKDLENKGIKFFQNIYIGSMWIFNIGGANSNKTSYDININVPK